jgi:hypothetical protein
MATQSNSTIITVTAVIVAVTEGVPRILTIDQDPDATHRSSDDLAESSIQFALPSGPFEPDRDSGLEACLRRRVEAQTGLDLYYVEQLYTFGNRYRDADEIAGGPRVVSVAYIALTHEDAVTETRARWRDWYGFLPWEDWRPGRPAVISDTIKPALRHWVKRAQSRKLRKRRQERVNVSFGLTTATGMDSVLTLERFELLYEAGIVAEAIRDQRAPRKTLPKMTGTALLPPGDELGVPMASDDRRVLATALGRLRGKLAYRPVVFELLPGEFTLLQLQGVAEALSGAKLHKQNFRRLVANADLVEPIGRTSTVGRGRPAELFRFRREVLGEKLTVGLARPVFRK